MPVEHRAHEMGDGVVAEAQRAEPLLEWRWGKQPAVEKRHRAEPTGGGGTIPTWCIERAEEQRT